MRTAENGTASSYSTGRRESSSRAAIRRESTTSRTSAKGLADATLGIKSAADALGLDFIPLTEEPYELVIHEEYMNHPGIVALLDSLHDAEWRAKVEEMGGYRWP